MHKFLQKFCHLFLDVTGLKSAILNVKYLTLKKRENIKIILDLYTRFVLSSICLAINYIIA